MNLTSRTKRLFIIAAIIAVVAVGVAVYLFIEIQRQGAQLSESLKVISEGQQQLEEFSRVQRLLAETEADRTQLDTVFFGDQTVILDFVTRVEEELGPRVGVSVQTTDITSLADPKKPQQNEQIRIGFRYNGSEVAVRDFSRLLETLPYHAWLDTLTLGRQADGWQGEATVIVTMQKGI